MTDFSFFLFLQKSSLEGFWHKYVLFRETDINLYSLEAMPSLIRKFKRTGFSHTASTYDSLFCCLSGLKWSQKKKGKKCKPVVAKMVAFNTKTDAEYIHNNHKCNKQRQCGPLAMLAHRPRENRFHWVFWGMAGWRQKPSDNTKCTNSSSSPNLSLRSNYLLKQTNYIYCL